MLPSAVAAMPTAGVDRGQAAAGDADQQAPVRVKGQTSCRAVELGEHRSRLVAGVGQAQHLLARGDIDRAINAFGHIVGAWNRRPDRRERVQPIVRGIAAVHRRNGMLIAVGEHDLLEITQEIGKHAHDL
jgi:hypothetical protein